MTKAYASPKTHPWELTHAFKHHAAWCCALLGPRFKPQYCVVAISSRKYISFFPYPDVGFYRKQSAMLTSCAQERLVSSSDATACLELYGFQRSEKMKFTIQTSRREGFIVPCHVFHVVEEIVDPLEALFLYEISYQVGCSGFLKLQIAVQTHALLVIIFVHLHSHQHRVVSTRLTRRPCIPKTRLLLL